MQEKQEKYVCLWWEKLSKSMENGEEKVDAQLEHYMLWQLNIIDFRKYRINYL